MRNLVFTGLYISGTCIYSGAVLILCERLGRTFKLILHSQKYWRELNLAVEPKIAIARILADLNLVVWYRIAIRIYASRKFWRILIWRV